MEVDSETSTPGVTWGLSNDFDYIVDADGNIFLGDSDLNLADSEEIAGIEDFEAFIAVALGAVSGSVSGLAFTNKWNVG